MGHYASEMDPDWGSRNREIEERIKTGFGTVAGEWFGKDILECPHCAALVIDWRKHARLVHAYEKKTGRKVR